MAHVLVVVDMQIGVLVCERFQADKKIAIINQLIDAADEVIFIRHCEGDMQPGMSDWQIVPQLHQPEHARYVSKTACDSFYRTTLAEQLELCNSRAFTICGCATDYCVDTTVKTGASQGYAITVAEDAHTTADRSVVSAQQLILQHNEVWAGLSVPGNPIRVMPSGDIINQWMTANA